MKKIGIILWISTVAYYGCGSQTRHEPPVRDSVAVIAAPVDSLPEDRAVDTNATDAVVVDTVTAIETSVALFQQTFEGEIEGFKSKSYTFTLPDDAQVSIRARDKKQAVFKLYRKTGELDETVVKDDTHTWKGELRAGDYQLKVFLPLKQAAKKKRATFQISVDARRG